MHELLRGFTINSRENIGDIDGHVNLAMLFQN